jgi:divalent metal cation (Fe/Co/Zn/Cd) transporter
MAKDKCRCMPGMGIVALILGVVGLYSIILGVKTQLASSLVYNNWWAMLYYLVGILVMACAKMSKHSAYCKCNMHKMN